MANVQKAREVLDQTCQQMFDVALEQARSAIELDDDNMALESYLTAAYLYLSFFSSGIREDRSLDYLEALEEIGKAYSNTGRLTEAVIAYTRAINFWQQEATGGSGHGRLIPVRSRLTEIYEQLRLWDWSHNIRKKLVETCPIVRRQEEEAKLKAVAAQNRGQRFEVTTAHQQFLRQLQQCRSALKLIEAVTRHHLDFLVKREQERLASSS